MMKSTCCSANEGLVVVHFCESFSHDGARMLHYIEWHLDGLQCKHILKIVIVPYVRQIYPNGILQFQQDLSFIHDFQVLHEWPLLLDSVELSGHHEHLMWTSSWISGVWWRKPCSQPGLFSPSERVIWPLVYETWKKVASCQYLVW